MGGLQHRAGRVAASIAGLRPWLRLLLALAAGGLLALTQPPFGIWPLLFPCMVLLIWLLDAAPGRWWRSAVLLAFLWAYFVVGLYWVGIAFFVDAARFAILLPLPVIGLPLLLGLAMLLPALPFLWHWPRDLRRVLLLALALAAGDYLRSFLFTGFPWNLFGYAWLGVDSILQAGGWIGVHGLGLLTLVLAGMPAVLADAPDARPRGGPLTWIGGAAALFAVIALLGGWRLLAHPEARLTDLRLRIVQPDVPQAEKWHPATREAHFLRSLSLSRRRGAGPHNAGPSDAGPSDDGPSGGEPSVRGAAGSGTPDLIVWPETAVPFFLANDEARRAQLASAVPGDGWLITGAPRFERPAAGSPAAAPTVWNSLHVVLPGGAIAATYDKRHLVPFGEYLPLRGLLSRFGLENLAQGGTDFTSGTVPGVIQWPGLPPFRALICYEGIFPAEIAEGPVRPAWLLNITNDAWFGDSSGPYQHFGMTRLRAIEQGLPLVRAANTGISAVIDPYGRAIARLGLGERGVLDAQLPAPLDDPPPYARFGDWLSLLPVLLVVALLPVARPVPQDSRRRRNRKAE